MHQLTIQQKIENLQEIKNQKQRKIENLQREISGIEGKIQRLKSKGSSPTTPVSTTRGVQRTSTPLEIIPEAVRQNFEYDPTAPSYESIRGF